MTSITQYPTIPRSFLHKMKNGKWCDLVVFVFLWARLGFLFVYGVEIDIFSSICVLSFLILIISINLDFSSIYIVFLFCRFSFKCLFNCTHPGLFQRKLIHDNICFFPSFHYYFHLELLSCFFRSAGQRMKLGNCWLFWLLLLPVLSDQCILAFHLSYCHLLQMFTKNILQKNINGKMTKYQKLMVDQDNFRCKSYRFKIFEHLYFLWDFLFRFVGWCTYSFVVYIHFGMPSLVLLDTFPY